MAKNGSSKPAVPKPAAPRLKAAGSGVADTAASQQVQDAVEAPPVEEARFPVVGLGASAGGLAAFESFFSGMPAGKDMDMAFVLVQHLAPDHKSLLAELVGRYTRMQVREVEEGMKVMPNCVYIITPDHDLAIREGVLHLLAPGSARGKRLPIDYFFHTLAKDQQSFAIGIVLSGTGSDGTQGLRAIQAAGGMTMAQNPESAGFDGMPRSALSAGFVHFELQAEKMAGQLFDYVARVMNTLPQRPAPAALIGGDALSKVFALLRNRTGHDFSHYKLSTIERRIERRMAAQQIDRVGDYVKCLQQQTGEIDALFGDLLIGVTSFFRDPAVFHLLQSRVLPALFAANAAGAPLRAWTVACSTGEEAYSLAILLQEEVERLNVNPGIQVFATDIDERAIATARTGRYGVHIAEDIAPERLARFFTLEEGGSTYRIHKGIRDLLVFSKQDVIKDPPISRLNLISCRNLMIYLDAAAQQSLLHLFHYALNPGGFLLLGSSEGIGDLDHLFAPVDRKAKLYQRRESAELRPRPNDGRSMPDRPAASATVPARSGRRSAPEKAAEGSRLPLRALTENAILQQAAPSAALVNAGGDILYLHGRTGMYLEPAPGEIGVNNILKMAREGLRHDLSRALRQAASSKQITRAPGILVKTNGHFTTVNLVVRPVDEGNGPDAPPLFLIILDQAPAVSAAEAREVATQTIAAGAVHNAAIPVIAADYQARIDALKQELRSKDEYLESANEALQSTNEDLQSANEEMQAVNEELQSSNEEMQTSKEELQSVNEELATVNTELQSKVADLSHANNDMNNLLAGTGIATVFVDMQLRILRFTPTVALIINLIKADLGRPVSHIVTNLVGYASLTADIESVLQSLSPVDRQVQTEAGSWFMMRIRPYRTLANAIEGAVITFVDISEIKRTRDELESANQRLRLAALVHDAVDAMIVHDLQGRIMAWNPAAWRMYGWTEEEAMQLTLRDRVAEPLRATALADLRTLSLAGALTPQQTRRLAKSGAVVEVRMTVSALRNEAGDIYAYAAIERAVAPGAGAVAPHAPGPLAPDSESFE